MTAGIDGKTLERAAGTESLPTVSVDYAGLNELFGDGSGSSDFSELEEIFRNKYMYYAGNSGGGGPADCWPIPYANTHRNSLCYNGALTSCMALVFRDYTMTLDSIYDEIIAKYGYERATKGGHEYAGGRTIWPKTLMEYYAEERGLKWNIIEEGKDGKTAFQQMKDALLANHPVVFGDGGYPMQFYADDTGQRTYTAPGGHTIMFYKYEDGVLWAKDTAQGPHMPYPENGCIDLESVAAKASTGYIGIIEYYLDETPSPKFPNIPKSMLYDDKDGKTAKTASVQSGQSVRLVPKDATPSSQGADSGVLLAESVSNRPASSSGPDEEIVSICRQVPPAGRDHPGRWISDVLASLGTPVGEDVPPSLLYEMCCESGDDRLGGTTETDPSRLRLEPGMAVIVPHIQSENEEERIMGHCGIYVGSDIVIHDVGKLEEITIDEFIYKYGGLMPVGWGRVSSSSMAGGSHRNMAIPASGTAIQDGSESAVPQISIEGASPVLAGYGYDEEEVRSAISGVVQRLVPWEKECVARLMGAWSSPDSSTGVIGYLIELDSGRSLGVTVYLAQDSPLIALESKHLVLDGSTIYDAENDDYITIPNESVGDELIIMGDFANMTVEEYLAPFLDPETAIR